MIRRTLPRRLTASLAASLALVTVLAPASLQAQSSEGALAQRWFYTEVVVFLRPDVLDFVADEDLVRFHGAAFPRSLQSFQVGEGEIGDGWALDAATRALLNFPVLDLLDPFDRPAPEDDPADEDADGEARGVAPPAIEPTLAPDPLLERLAAIAEFEAGLESQSYRWLDPATFTLTAEANRLSRAGGYPVLLHGRWLQPVPPRQAPEPLLIQAGPRYGDAYALEGTLDVTLGRFLHFNADLVYREPLIGAAPIDRPQAPNGAPAPRPAPTLADLSAAGFMHLQESRRVRSGELHYLDHPKLGVLVRIEPVELPGQPDSPPGSDEAGATSAP